MNQKELDVKFVVDNSITPQEFRILLGRAIYGGDKEALKELSGIVFDIKFKD